MLTTGGAVIVMTPPVAETVTGELVGGEVGEGALLPDGEPLGAEDAMMVAVAMASAVLLVSHSTVILYSPVVVCGATVAVPVKVPSLPDRGTGSAKASEEAVPLVPVQPVAVMVIS